MQILKPNVRTVLDTRRAKMNGLYPVKLRVTYSRQQQYYSTNINLSKQDYLIVMNPELADKGASIHTRREWKNVRLRIDAIIVKSNQAIEKLPAFTFDAFEKAVFAKRVKLTDPQSIYKNVIDTLSNAEKIGTASNYKCSMNSLFKFKSKISFSDITVDFLYDYENWLLAQGKSISTVGIYLRPLRAILNIAIDEGLYPKESYPFSRRKYQIPASKNTKKALTLEEVKSIYNYPANEGSWYQRARDMWLFSYLANGMNFKDIALLKHEYLDGDYIKFTREKTKNNTRASIKQVSVYISDELRIIINRWKTNDTEIYLFGILKEGQSIYKRRSVLTQFIKMINRYILRIVKDIGIDKHVTTYFARHSFATILKRKGISLEMISESLGHESIKTTSSYLDSFDDESKKEISKLLVNF